MEGINFDQPPELTPFYWSPGWNSNQSLQKFQDDVDGPLQSSSAGQRLIEKKTDVDANFLLSAPSRLKLSVPKKVKINNDQYQLTPIYCIHGSEEMSSYTDEISELAGEAFIAIGKNIAENLCVKNGDGLIVTRSGTKTSLEVKILNRIASSCVGFSVGYFETRNFSSGNLVSLTKDNKWQRRIPQIIATDKASKIPPTSSGETLHA